MQCIKCDKVVSNPYLVHLRKKVSSASTKYILKCVKLGNGGVVLLEAFCLSILEIKVACLPVLFGA